MWVPVTALKECHERHLLVLCSFQDVLRLVHVGVDGDVVLTWKVDLQPRHIGPFLVHGTPGQSHECLHRRNVAGVEVHLHIVHGLALPGQLHGRAVMSLVNVLVDVLDGLDRDAALHIDVPPILQDEVATERHHVTIVILEPTSLVTVDASGVTASIADVGVFGEHGLTLESFGESLCAPVVLVQASLVTWPMCHVAQYQVVEHGFFLRIGELGTDEVVHILRGPAASSLIYNDQEMRVGKATLLKLDGVDVSDCTTKNAMLHNVVQQGISLELENAAEQVGAILGSLTGQ